MPAPPRRQKAANIAAIETMAHDFGLASAEDLLRFPLFVQIETVSICNARCVMCPVEEWQRGNRLMPDDLFARVLDQLRPEVGWLRKVTIQLDGEPLIDKKLEHRIRALKDIGVRAVAFATNGSLMREARARSILESGVDEVSFSIDGVTKATFEAMRRGLDFDEVTANARAFVRLRDAMKVPCRVRIRMVVNEGNAGEFAALKAQWGAVLGPGDSVYGKYEHNWGAWRGAYALPNPIDRAALNTAPCPSPWTSLIVLSDGRVPLCCADFNATLSPGDARTETLTEIWRNRLLARVRAGHLAEGRNSLPLCVDCNMWDSSTRVE